MKILFVAAEGAPFSKTGGLGDVIGALPKSLVKAGHEVAVILPYYDMVEAKFGNQIEDVLHYEVSVGWRRQYCGIKKTVLNGVTFYFIDSQYYFFRGYAYEFSGYWKDVGTIESLWEANMEYISPENALDSRNRQWKIYSRNLISPPNFLGANADVEDSLVVDGCFVDGTVKHSILSTGAQVREGAEVVDSVIMSGAIIGQGAKIKRAIIGEGAIISDGVEIDGTDEVEVVGYDEVVGVATDED